MSRTIITRTSQFDITDFTINEAKRTVDAYAATFDDPYEVMDADGHYDEILNSKVFNQAIKLGAVRTAQVFFNHGLDLYGRPSDRFSMPVGTPEEIRADGRGLVTSTRYAATPLGDEILQLWKDGAIRAQSFRGPIYQSRNRGMGPNGRPVIERLQLGLREYGPTPIPANAGAGLIAIRSQLLDQLREQFDELTPEERRELETLLAETPALGDGTQSTTEESGTEEGTGQQAETPGQSTKTLELAHANRRRR